MKDDKGKEFIDPSNSKVKKKGPTLFRYLLKQKG
jgi:hypothetical protein